MKKLLLVFVFLVGIQICRAQDRICKMDQTVIEAKVLEITPDEVCYKRFSNLEGPSYRLPITQIRYIDYANGEREFFTEPSDKQTESKRPMSTEASAEPRDDASDRAATVVRAYQVGDLYQEGDVRGVVIATTDDGLHGLILSMDQVLGRWDCFEKEDFRKVGADSQSSGEENMAAVERYIAEHGLTWDHFPAFQWCRQLGDGWYLPAIDEWLTISFNFNGGSRTTFNRVARNRVNDTLRKNGGKRLDKMLYYYSSTEQDERMAKTSHMAIEPPYVVPLKKNGLTYLVRAVRRF